MALQLSYTDSFSEEYPEAYFRLVQCNICVADKSGQVTFYAYPNAAKKGKRVIGQRSYAITPETYDTYFATSVLKTKDPYKQAYELAKATKDVGEGLEAKSFFDGAIDV